MTEEKSLIPFRSNAPRLTVEYVPICSLTSNARNPRRHPEKQIVMLARNIDTFGFLVPCLIDEKRRLLSGTARVLAAQRLGMPLIPVIPISHLSEAEKRGFIVADNKLAEQSVWDPDILRQELQFFSDLDVDFDFSVIGFETPEVDALLCDTVGDDGLGESAMTGQQGVSSVGDLWLADPHRVLCGDALVNVSYEAVLQGERAQLVVSDPPYNVQVRGHVGGRGRIVHRDFEMAAGEMTPDQFTAFLATVMSNLTCHSQDGSLHYICIDWRHCREILAAGTPIYAELKNICVWCKTNAGMGSLYRSQHEFVFVFKNGTAPHINNINLGVHGRNRSNLWNYAGINSFGKDRDELLAMHPTVKPVAMVMDIIKDASARGGLVLDAFGGSGSTLVAAEKTKRRAALIEIDPIYVDRAIRRWQALTGKDAVCARSGQTFAEREAEVHANPSDQQVNRKE
jgi:DNA methylase/ParB/Sulfiredoxin domain